MAVSDCNSSTAWAVCWQDIPDPRDAAAPYGRRTQIRLDRTAWRHIVGKHVSKDRQGPWRELFSAEVLKDLRRVSEPYCLEDRAVACTVLRLEAQICRSLERPFVPTYAICEAGSSPVGGTSQHWVLVLPTGATAFAHAYQANNRLATCYFSDLAGVESKEHRWRRVVRRLVFYYAICDNRRAFRLPNEHRKRFIPTKGATREMVTAIHLIVLSNWGFCGSRAGAAWQGRLTAWPAAGTSVAVSPLRAGHPHRLKPRRQW